ncbi:MAG: PIN domain-containing protein [Bacteroidaceae bacterium]|nr:PIN domain-containing protein [Bacteroidaceae bacterium]
MKRIFIDTNVVIDFLARRSQFFNSACGVISCSQKGYLILVSSLSFATTSYILAAHHKIPEQAIKNIFANFVNTCRITTVDTVTISDAISSQFTDFEDAM